MKFRIPLFLLVSVSVSAAPIKGTWQFKRTDGVIGTVKLSGDYPSCVVHPAGNDINVSLEIDGLSMRSPSCYEGTLAEAIVKGTFRRNDGSLFEATVSFGQSFSDMMESYKKLGSDAVGPIGNDGEFPCPSTASAFLVIDGYLVNDPNEDIVGYCLNP